MDRDTAISRARDLALRTRDTHYVHKTRSDDVPYIVNTMDEHGGRPASVKVGRNGRAFYYVPSHERYVSIPGREVAA